MAKVFTENERHKNNRKFAARTGELKVKETYIGVALLSLSPRMDVDNIGVDFDVVRDVIARTIAAKKSWNVDVVNFATFDALSANVKEATISQYGEKTTSNA